MFDTAVILLEHDSMLPRLPVFSSNNSQRNTYQPVTAFAS